jgi:allophanate hydrolase
MEMKPMPSINPSSSLDFCTLSQRYRAGETTPTAVIRDIYQRIQQYADPAVWIYLAPIADSLVRAKALERKSPDQFPLYGIPFAIKDNLDWADVPTTAGCPAFAYTPERSATVVERLLAAGAIPIGKTNLDQFATGLVGTRSPYGVCRNPFDASYIPGGSSSGSGVAVSAGLVSFALGTDTAGSGRVPAAFTNIVGLKPTKGLISTRGLVPAVRSLDCVSIFALTCADAATVLEVAGGYDGEDIFSRQPEIKPVLKVDGLRVGIPDQLEFFGNLEAEQCYRGAIAHLKNLGCQIREIDFSPFAAAAQLLYGGPWVAERLAAIEKFLDPALMHPIVYEIIQGGKTYDAVTTFRAGYHLAELRQQAELQWQQMDVLAVPTTGTIYTLDEVEAEPVQLNSNLGRYTNFVNLLDLCALAIPSGFQGNGLPTGLTLIAPAWQDRLLSNLGTVLQAELNCPLGATGIPLAALSHPLEMSDSFPTPDWIKIAVVGAHLSGQPLNYQLTGEQGTLVRNCRTQPIYKLYALTGGAIPKPGLVRQAETPGYAIEVEVWLLPAAGWGRFVANIPSPLGIGTLILEDGEQVKGFLCESFAIADATEISDLGGWRGYLASLD